MKTLVAVGVGGNIGSHLIPHLARMPEVGRIVLIDRDTYDPTNLRGQDIRLNDVKKGKARVQAQRLRQIRPDLELEVHSTAVERLPIGLLRGELLLACLDSRASRQYVNEVAIHLGMPWIDAGVDGPGLLARVNVYFPGHDQACIECGWSDADYRIVEQHYSCLERLTRRGVPDPPPTNSPSGLGALAASLQVIECQKLLADRKGALRAQGGYQILLDQKHHRHFLTRLPRNAECRLQDHAPWDIESVHGSAQQMTVRQAAARFSSLGAEPRDTEGPAVSLNVGTQPFVKRLTCIDCGKNRSLLHLENRLSAARLRCSDETCSGVRGTGSFDRQSALNLQDLSPAALDRKLHRFGIRDGDVLSFYGAQTIKHFEISNDRK